MLSVAIIDDEKWVRASIKAFIPWRKLSLRLCGEASDGRAGLGLCRRLQPQIIIADIRMPEIDGLEMITRLRSCLPDSKIVIISGYDDFHYAQQAIKLGVSEYLLKPVEEEALVSALRRAKQEYQSARMQREETELYKRSIPKLEAFLNGDISTKVESKENIRIQKALQYIQSNYNRSLSLPEVASKVFVESTYFSTIFKKYTGQGFCRYLTDYRLQIARKLLENPELKVKEVAHLVGYSDANYFSRVYRTKFGCTCREK
jgi:two-component system response regulator YesN